MNIPTIRLIAPLLCGLMMLVATMSGFAGNPISGVGVSVETSPGGSIIWATLHENDVNFGGTITVQLPGPGTYIFRYTSGPKKGQVLKTVRATKAGPVSVSVPKSSAAK